MMTTGMGYANAASSIAALVFGGRFDLTRTYFLISGIAGVDPAQGTLGSAHWARFVIDGGLQNEIDPREAPSDWTSGYLAMGAPAPGEKAELHYGDEVYRLNEQMLQAAFRLTKGADLVDSDAAKAYRAKYAEPASTPRRRRFRSATRSLPRPGGTARAWRAAMEAYARHRLPTARPTPAPRNRRTARRITALKRGAEAGLIDFTRIAVLRTAANFDREAPAQSAAELLRARSGGYVPSVANAHRLSAKLANAIVEDWATWSVGPPK